MKQSKVTQTRMHKIHQISKQFEDKSYTDIGYKVPVAEGKLVLLNGGRIFGANDFEEMRKAIKPIIISETEKIEEGDQFLLNDDHPQGRIRTCYRITKNNSLWNGKDWDTLKGDHYFIDPTPEQGAGFVTELECKKILALPENFSPKHLQAIVDGKTKDGDKVLVECVGFNYPHQERDFVDHYEIKLNSEQHITLHKVEVKTIELTTDDRGVPIIPLGLIFNIKGVDYVGSCDNQGRNFAVHPTDQVEHIKTHTEEEFKEVYDALSGIIEIGKRDMSNPKYDGYFKEGNRVCRKYMNK